VVLSTESTQWIKCNILTGGAQFVGNAIPYVHPHRITAIVRMADIIDGRIGAHKLYQAIVWEQGFVGKIVKICFGFLIPFLRFFAAETATPKRRRHILWLWGLILRAPVTQIPFLNPLCTDCEPRKTHRTRVLWSRALRRLNSAGLAVRPVLGHFATSFRYRIDNRPRTWWQG